MVIFWIYDHYSHQWIMNTMSKSSVRSPQGLISGHIALKLRPCTSKDGTTWLHAGSTGFPGAQQAVPAQESEPRMISHILSILKIETTKHFMKRNTNALIWPLSKIKGKNRKVRQWNKCSSRQILIDFLHKHQRHPLDSQVTQRRSRES